MVAGRTDAARAIEALSDELVRHFNAGNVEEMARRFYADDATILPPGQAMVGGRQQIRDVFRGPIQAGMRDLAIETVKVETSGDLAYRVGRHSMGGPAPDHGKFVDVHRRQADGSWKCVADIINSDQATS